MKAVGIVLSFGYYLVMALFLGSYIWRAVMWMKDERNRAAVHRGRMSPLVFLKAAGDIISFRRLLMVNDVLWIGELAFHASFVLIVLRHLRYFLEPVPGWVEALQPLGVLAGYVFPLALVYIFIRKIVIERVKYISPYNLLLLSLLVLLGVTGLLLKTVFRTDITAVKAFALGIVTFRPAPAPDSVLFIIHFVLFLVLVAYLPTHVFSAPLSILDARQREKGFRGVIHEK
ncbi:MAG: hypothetical protein K8I29_03710 [Alphaproteobacteria bacterium]|uniref:NarG-like domain-containing protein n=1 Tax=Candidatus Nitrobium versatile TaxID=2884831 RepID=A0A953JAW8_9BACT|nr:hypothetical protein [Candidatus Nitrobium versatile]